MGDVSRGHDRSGQRVRESEDEKELIGNAEPSAVVRRTGAGVDAGAPRRRSARAWSAKPPGGLRGRRGAAWRSLEVRTYAPWQRTGVACWVVTDGVRSRRPIATDTPSARGAESTTVFGTSAGRWEVGAGVSAAGWLKVLSRWHTTPLADTSVCADGFGC